MVQETPQIGALRDDEGPVPTAPCGISPSSKRNSTSQTPNSDDATAFDNNENHENGMLGQQQRLSKRSKMEKTSTMPHQPSSFTSTSRRTSGSSVTSFTSAASSSASYRHQHQPNYHESRLRTPQTKPPQSRPKGAQFSSSSAATTLVQRMVENGTANPTSAKKYFTPLRMKMKPKINKAEVEATDTGYASVAKLSQWLAADPTSTQKLRHVRRGRNVIAKSRQFEKDLEGVVVEEAQISRGSVNCKKSWLNNAFKESDEDHHIGPSLLRSTGPKRYAQSEIGTPTTFAMPSSHCARGDHESAETRSDMLLDDSASSFSVSDKKDWLKNAFSKQTPTKFGSHGSIKATSEILDLRGANRDEATSRAKNRFRERSARKLLVQEDAPTPTPTPTRPTTATPSKRPVHRQVGTPVTVHSGTKYSGANRSHAQPGHYSAQKPRCHEPETRTGPPVPPKRSDYVVDEDRSSVDFRAARELIVNRSKTNGNSVHVFNNKLTKQQPARPELAGAVAAP